MTTTNPLAPPQKPATAEVIAGPWPCYSGCRHLPERERWEVYGLAKAGRAALEDRGIVMDEAYDDFITRVTRELGL
ncbi:hypothetical protein K0P33_21225 [Pseudomonas sp. ArH3a]|uniref:hypothetical protein n=1 Tax=Pseudomonas sp. ArH3a TaxID=2862945 RepID=UPI001F58593A|nr:hypothetical protein [Pseudomonas sp. ArH3a]UNM18063.1 hypothetical protein K0P33_21225 [Pseudomonas sp. ArH3a]